MNRHGNSAGRLRPLLALAGILASGAAAGDPCLRSGSGAVSITGTLIQKVVPGDGPQLRWFVRLEDSMCVVGEGADGTDAPDASDVRVVQLVLPRKTMNEHTDLVGRRVTATGFVSTRQLEGQNAVVILDTKTIQDTR